MRNQRATVPPLPAHTAAVAANETVEQRELVRRLRLVSDDNARAKRAQFEAEAKAVEANELADDARDAYARIQRDFATFRRARDAKSTQTSAAVTLLEDKLRAKQREVDQLVSRRSPISLKSRSFIAFFLQRIRCDQYEDQLETSTSHTTYR